jgi:hypothetical protein
MVLLTDSMELRYTLIQKLRKPVNRQLLFLQQDLGSFLRTDPYHKT